MLDVNAVRCRLMAEIEGFEREVNAVYSTLVLPHWGNDELHGFPQTLYGYMMVCFAHIDLFSAYWRGDTSPIGQTQRMIDFMQRYLSPNREACGVAVQMWRHTLMHTGAPRFLVDKDTQNTYRWLLHWGEHLPSDQHFTLNEGSHWKKLNMGLLYLIRDLRAGLDKYLADLSEDAELQEKFEQVEAQIESGRFKAH